MFILDEVLIQETNSSFCTAVQPAEDETNHDAFLPLLPHYRSFFETLVDILAAFRSFVIFTLLCLLFY